MKKRTLLVFCAIIMMLIITTVVCYILFCPKRVSFEYPQTYENLPQKEIVFKAAQDTIFPVLGFTDTDGSGVISREFPLTQSMISSYPDAYLAIYSPVWSPDGKYLLILFGTHTNNGGYPALISMDGQVEICPGNENYYSYYRSQVVSGKKVIIIHPEEVLLLDMQTCRFLKTMYQLTSPSGKKGWGEIEEFATSNQGWNVVRGWWTTGELENPETRDYAYIIDPDQKKIEVEGSYFTWSPDGEWLAYIGEGGSLYQMRKDGKNQEMLVQSAGGITISSWSPDANWLVYCRQNSEGKNILYKINVKTKEIVEIPTGDIEIWGAPNWRWKKP